MAPKARHHRGTGRSSSSLTESLWIQIEGSPRPIELETSGLKNVNSLLEKVKEKVAPRLNEIPVDSLQLFLNRAAPEAFEPDLLASALPGGSNVKEALYVKIVTLEQAVGMASEDMGQDPNRSE